MKTLSKNILLKAFFIALKGMLVARFIIFLFFEAHITQNREIAADHIQYVAIITTLCWSLFFWIFIPYKLKHYLFMLLALAAFLQMFFFNLYIKRAHLLDSCLDHGLVWDYDQHLCRNDCLSWNDIQKCIPL